MRQKPTHRQPKLEKLSSAVFSFRYTTRWKSARSLRMPPMLKPNVARTLKTTVEHIPEHDGHVLDRDCLFTQENAPIPKGEVRKNPKKTENIT